MFKYKPALVTAFLVALPLVASGSLSISEFLAINSSGISDNDDDRSDWIEIHNSGTSAVDLTGWYLTDDSNNLSKWRFPKGSVNPGGYLIVYASGKDFSSIFNPEIHTNFKLSGSGEYLALVEPDGGTISSEFAPAYPSQRSDISYGIPTARGVAVYYQNSSPGKMNSGRSFSDVVQNLEFSSERGFYDTPLQLEITSPTPGVTIRYTTDGSAPSLFNFKSLVYTEPINITTTSTIRADAVSDGLLPATLSTHTYIFLEDVVKQPSNPPGWPSDWGSVSDRVGGTVPSDYEMDQRVVDNTNGLGVHTVEEGLLDIPTIAISMRQSRMTGGDRGVGGIYTDTEPSARFEYECAVEYILPDGTPGFQENCIIETHGNASRRKSFMQKHSVRLTFRSSVGVGRLKFPLFPGSDVEEFNQVVLRACFTDSWAQVGWNSDRWRPNDAQYIRDVWMKDSLSAMGHPSSRGTFVHVYLNGLYFGLHNLTERVSDDWYADYLGGNPEDWQIYDDFGFGAANPAPARWNDLISVLNGNIRSSEVYERAQEYIDIDNYIDYMFLHFYADGEDWPHHNGYAAANVESGDGKFRFNVWDQEIIFDQLNLSRHNDSRGGGAPFQRLRMNSEFRMRFADRVYKHMFNGGALSEQSSIDRYLSRANEIDKAIVAESARWGDVQANTPYGDTARSSNNVDAEYYPPTLNTPIYFTREQHWTVERDNIVTHYIPTLHDQSNRRSALSKLRASRVSGQSLYPSIDPPVFEQHGGVLPEDSMLGITAMEGSVYITTDGSDPRLPGGDVNPNASVLPLGEGSVELNETGPVKARARLDSSGEWSALAEAVFIVGSTASSSNLVISEIFYNPQGATEDTEFIELMNSSSGEIDLTGVRLTGVTYAFPDGFTLASLERVVIVKDQAAFAAAYETVGRNIASGDFGNTSLANSGEELAVIAQDGMDIRRFSYNDSAPWPESPDGLGYSLVLIAPETNPDPTLPESWRPSSALGGAPGNSDASTFSGDPNVDLDGDSISAFLEYALGTSDSIKSSSQLPFAEVASLDLGEDVVEDYLTFTFQRNLAADDVVYEVQTGTDLEGWAADTSLVSRVNNGDGTATEVYRVPNAEVQQYVRLKVTKR